MGDEKLREDVITNLRACLISIKGKCDLKQIRADYRLLMGEDIPYFKLGYKNLEQFICSIPTISTSKNPTTGQLVIEAKANQKTSHIAALVKQQKEKPKKRSRFVPKRSSNSAFHVNKPMMTRWKPKALSSKVVPKTPPRQSIVTHNQFVNHPKHQPTNLPPRLAKQRLLQQQQTESYIHNSNDENIDYNNKYHGDSVLAAAKKRIVKKMSSTSLQDFPELDTYVFDLRDKLNSNKNLGGNELFNTEKTFQNTEFKNNNLGSTFKSQNGSTDEVVTKFTLTGDNIEDLKAFAKKYELGEPTIKVITRKSKSRKPTNYDCQIKIGTHSFTSYPEDFTDEHSALQYTAKLALDEIIPKYSRHKSLLLSNELDILERIPPIVEKHYHGIWNWQLEADYKDMFNEQLPVNWMEIIDVLPCISVVPCLENKFVLKYCKPEEVFQKGLSSYIPLVSNVSVPSSMIKFEEDGTLIADITCAVSASEIWCRQVGTPESDEFDKMLEKMEERYNLLASAGRLSKPPMINVGGFFVANYDQVSWIRVRVLDIEENNVNCFFIDYGDECVIPKLNIYQLEREFAKEHAQAFLCQLAGLELLEEASVNSESMHNLLCKRVQIQAAPPPEDASDIRNPGISVIMYDIETGVVLNEELISSITMESATPILKKDIPTEVRVSHVAQNGDIYVQVHSQGFSQLLSMLEDLENDIKENKLEVPKQPPTPESAASTLYLSVHPQEGRWQRAKIIDWAPKNVYAQLHYIDIGDTEIIKVGEKVMYPLEEINDIANRFPTQAVKVRMAIEKIPPDFVEKVEKLMPHDQSVLLKVVRVDGDGMMFVEFFKRSDMHNVLFPVNKSLELSVENRSADNNQPQTNKLKKLISLNQFEELKNVPSSGTLGCPVLPTIGNYFDVKVPCAVNPWNFFVQPYESHEKLSKLMVSLQERYGDQHFSPLNIEDIYPGGIYASRHEDGLWYRTSVIKVIHSGSISVFYCDFGYYGNLTLDQLVPLDKEFMELPYQAIKAKLAGIKPKHNKWTMDDCIYFEKLVCRKNFVSVLVSIDKDELYRCDTVLSLKLIDTSTEDDIYIDRDLVEKGIAVDTD